MVEVKASANMNSFHAAMKASSPVVTTPGSKVGQGRHADLADHGRRLGILRDGIDVGPVAQERALAGGERLPRRLLVPAQHVSRTDLGGMDGIVEILHGLDRL